MNVRLAVVACAVACVVACMILGAGARGEPGAAGAAAGAGAAAVAATVPDAAAAAATAAVPAAASAAVPAAASVAVPDAASVAVPDAAAAPAAAPKPRPPAADAMFACAGDGDCTLVFLGRGCLPSDPVAVAKGHESQARQKLAKGPPLACGIGGPQYERDRRAIQARYGSACRARKCTLVDHGPRPSQPELP
jgi:hypothetical protein